MTKDILNVPPPHPPLAQQLPQEKLVASLRSRLSFTGARPAADRSDHAAAVPAQRGIRLAAAGGSSGQRLVLEAAACGIDLSGWNADWHGARLFLSGIGRAHEASLGGL